MVISGTTVAISLVALITLPIPFFRGIGIGVMLIPLVSVIVTITLLPVILATVGPKLDWPKGRRAVSAGHGWEHWGTLIIEHRWASAVIGLLLLGALLIPATWITIGEPRPDALNGRGPAQAGLVALEESGINTGVMSPFEVIVHGDPTGVAAVLDEVDGVRGAVAPESGAWRRDGTPLIAP